MSIKRGKSLLSIAASLILLCSLIGGTWASVNAAETNASVSYITPTISIVSVDPDKTVTIRTANYPANDTFNVYMNYFGTRGIGGTKVTSVDTGSGGSFEKTFTIPDDLKGLAQIAIRLESPYSGYYSYDWFNNVSGGTVPNTGGPYTYDDPYYGALPTISISSVAPDATVTITTYNYPANDVFNVYMGYFGTRGIDGIQVDTINTGSGGSQNYTFTIPNDLKGLAQIAIRLESPTSGFYSYNWFNNISGGTIPNTGGPYTYSYTGLTPTFTVTGVSTDSTVTIQTANFPANDTFNVYMGEFGTRGVGGTSVGSVDTGSGGALTFTFNIPDAVKGDYQIAIRLESPSSGYYSYNWFYNAY